MSTYYITTPIYYVNDKPHIGHAYTTILADVLARYHRELGDEVFFLTGLDEHGQKVQQAAEARGVGSQQHCDEMAPRFLELWDKLGISYDDFIRTTEDRHKTIVQQVLQAVYDSGDIYKGEYEGWYSVSEERFISDKERETGEFRDVRKIKEPNYYFKMGKYQEQLVQYIHDHPEFILPPHRRNEILGKLREPIDDLCISRPKSRLEWGVEIPFDTDYVTYVWFDALLNYVSAPGYGSNEETFGKWWPADVHLIGKDILMTHAIYWPTMLFSAGIPLPKCIFAHGWWLTEKDDGEAEKMSKSLGNVVNPLDLIDQYGVDPVRYYLMREMVLGQDSNFSLSSFIKRYNSDLANDLGNLVSRVNRLITRNFDGKLPRAGEEEKSDAALRNTGESIGAIVAGKIEEMKVNEAVETTIEFVRSINIYLEQHKPWMLLKTEEGPGKARAGTVLFYAAEAVRLALQLLHPIMPDKVRELLGMVGDHNPDFTTAAWGRLKSGVGLNEFTAPFPRIEVERDSTPREKKEPKLEKEEPKVSDNLISYDDFIKVDLKIAEIIGAEKIEKADKLLKLQVKVGDEQRQIVAGLAGHYTLEELPGKKIVIVANLAPAKIRGVESQGMLLAADDGETLSLLSLDRDITSGAKVR
ncbi:MAG: methionine--tRNA ligase [Planctomycetota bacterium]|nr:methionine--tRNA ligase [Planctomycetota bacterium]